MALPRLSADPDARLVRWGWIAWAAFTALIAVRWILFEIADTPSAAKWVLITPLIGLWLLWPLWRGGDAMWRWMRDAPYAAWNGSYYEFDGHQVRVLFDDDDVYLVADDLFAVLDLRGNATNAERVRAIAGRDGLRTLPGRREVVFTERGLTAWLDRRTDAQTVRLRRWFERDVLAPHRKRREIQTGRVNLHT